MESTYGDRIHKESKDYTLELAKIIQETFDKGGNVVIPSFAVGRTQVSNVIFLYCQFNTRRTQKMTNIRKTN